MAKLTGGEVVYLRRVKTGDYEHKEMSAKISWSADEDEAVPSAEAMSQRAADHAVHVVHTRLGLVADYSPQNFGWQADTAGALAALEKARQIAGAAEHAPLSATAPPKRGRKAATPTPAATEPAPSATAPAGAASATGDDELLSGPTDTAPPSGGATDEDLLGPTNPTTETTSEEPSAASSADPLLAEIEASLAAPAVTEISDADLGRAVSKKFADPSNKTKFPAFKLGLPKFAPQIDAIPTDQRGAFLTWLGAL